jgi:adenylate cyclase
MSSFYFKGKQATLQEIAHALNVTHVLEGTVRTSGQTLRITADLVSVDTGTPVWSESYDRKLDDVFKIQDDIAGSVVGALKVSLLGTPACCGLRGNLSCGRFTRIRVSKSCSVKCI